MGRWRAVAAGALTTGAVVVVVLAALLADGRVGSESLTNDGGAWLLNRSESVIGHVNRVVGEVDATTPGFSGRYDVSQSSDVVVVNDRGASRAVLIDTTLTEIGAPVTISPTTEVIAVPSGVVLTDPATGSTWRFAREQFGTVQELVDEVPLVQSAAGATVVVGREGSVLVVEPDTSTISLARPGEVGVQLPVEDWPGGDVVGATFAGHIGVVALDNGIVLVVDDDGVERLDARVDFTLLQQPSDTTTMFAGVTDDGDIALIGIETGEELRREPLDGGDPIAPILHDGCVWTVTTTPTPVFHHCEVDSPLPNAGIELKLVLVNGWVWVNDVNQGSIWIVREDEVEVDEINDWTAALNLSDNEDQTDESTGGEEDLVENANAEELAEDVDELDDDDRNSPPIAEDDFAQTRRGRPIVIRVLENDTDEDNDPLAVESLSGVDAEGATAAGALVSVTADGSAVQVIPPEDFVGDLQFGYVVHDGRQGRDDADVTLTVSPPDEASNRAPVPVDDNATVRAGKSVSLNVLNNDTDPDGDTLVLVSVDGGDGAVNYAPDGEVTYSPDVTSAEGTIELAYVVADDYAAEANGTIRIRVRRADSNQPPQARNDVGRTSVGRPVIVDVLANDMDPDGDPLSVQNLQSLDSTVTTAQLTPDGRFLFRPEAVGTYRFSYTVSDGPEVDQAQIRIDVDDVADNRPPVAVVDEVALAIGESRLVRVLDNDGDPDGDVVGIVEWVGVPGLEITEVPGIGFNVMATPQAEPRSIFRYFISDGLAPPVRGDVIVSALQREPVDYPPVAVADSVDVRAGQTTELHVLRNDFDPEGKVLRIAEPLVQPSEGLLRMSPDRQTLLLTANADQQFSFDFTYDIEDPAGNRSSTVVSVRIVPANQPNRAPIAGPDVARTPAATPVVIPVLSNDFDPDGDPITVESIAEQPQHGTVEILEDETIVFTPNAGFAGTDSFVYTLVDGYQPAADSTVPADQRGPGRDLGEVYIGVMPAQSANRPPTAVDDVGFPPVKIGSEPVLLDVLANDSDPDADPLIVTEVAGLTVGEASVGSAGRIVEFTPPDEGEPRRLTFTYAIADGRGGTASAQVSVDLVAEPDPVPPEAADDRVGPVRAGEEVVFDPRENDVDPDGEREELVVLPDNDLMTVLDDGRVRVIAPEATADIGYRVRDPQGLESELAFVTVLVAENEAPVVEPIVIETDYNTAVIIDLHDAVTDPDEDPLVITLGQQRSGGSVTVVGQPADSYLQVEFTPDTDFEGGASFDYTVDDRFGHIVAGNVTVTVLPPENRPPEAAPISVDAEAGTPAPIRLADAVTDPDPDGKAQHSYSISGPSKGNVTLDGPSADGVVTIRSAVDGGGATDSFTYTVTDGEFEVSNTVSIDVAIPTFAPPAVQEVNARVLQGESTASIDLLQYAVDNSPADLRGEGLTVTAVGVSPNGDVRQNGNSVVFTPNPDFFGQASFTFTVQDGRRSTEGESDGLVVVDVVGRPGKPQPPTVGTPGNEYLVVSWGAPQADEARAPVTGYVLEYSASDGTSGSTRFDRPTTQHRWEGLTNAVDYCFRVAAVNEAGDGDFSNEGECKAPDVRPERPATPTAEFGDQRLTVNWAEPLNRGSEIINYQLRISGGRQDLSPELGVVTSYVWEGLENGTDYTFEVRAQNSADTDNDGWSEWSPLSSAEHPLTVPDAPDRPDAVRGDRQVEITWNAPYDGGDEITLYQVRSSVSPTWVNVTPQGAVNTHTWENIPNGTDVSFQVRAVNRDPGSTTPGNISPSSPVVRTCSVPDAPAKPTLQRPEGDKQVVVRWTPPNAQGCAITEYRITGSHGASQTAGPGAESYTFGGLTNGSSYTFTVTAINEVVTVDGVAPKTSAASDPGTPFGPPLATNVTEAVNTGVRQVRVSWQPTGDNGSPITGYQIQVNGGAWTNVGNVTTVTRTEGSDGANYTYRVRAVNAAGPSPNTGASRSVTTWSTPGTPGVSASGASTSTVNSSWTTPSNGGTGLTAHQAKITTGSGCSSSGTTRNNPGSPESWGGLSSDTSYRICVRYQNAVGWGPWGTAVARTQAPPQPSISLSRGAWCTNCDGTGYSGYWYDVTLRNWSPNQSITLVCHDSVDSSFWSQSFRVDGNGYLRETTLCFSSDGPNHWVTGGGRQSNTVVW